MQRYDIINKIIQKYGFKNYLEIGVCDPNICFNLINCENKDSVDPGVEFSENPVKYQYTSDEFFTKLNRGELDKDPNFKWDVVFIDGLHISDQVLRDINNAMQHLSPNGFIMLHDCNPPEIFYAREDYVVDGRRRPWNGTVWKALYFTRTNEYYRHFNICTVNTDWGVGIMRLQPNNEKIMVPFSNMFFEYNKMAENRTVNLGLIEVDQLEDWLDNKFII